MKTVLITGASGFLGRSIFSEIKDKFRTITVGRNFFGTSDQHFFFDFSTTASIHFPDTDYVIHCASKAHIVPQNDEEAMDFFITNVEGTRNLLHSLEHNESLSKFVYISSVAVYGLINAVNVNEDAALLAIDPYGKSKIDAEKLISDWCAKKGIDLYIFRLPLIAGKQAPGNLGLMVEGIKAGRYFSIGKAKAKKSMVLADDLAIFLSSLEGPPGIYNLTDGCHPSFHELESKILNFYKKKRLLSIPFIVAKVLALAGDLLGNKFPINTTKLKKITSSLTFDDSKAKALLKWNPREVLKGWEIE